MSGPRSAGPLSWTIGTVAAVTGGRCVGRSDATVSSVTTDSRLAEAGSLFVAIRGEQVDGHSFVAAALDRGAAGVLVDRRAGIAAEPRVEVDDPVVALLRLAEHRRTELAVPVVAVTGSTGKTSTKDLLASALPGAWASPRSYNNELGVPLTILATPSDAAYLVAEVGSRGRGHIASLMAAVRPDVSIVTNLGLVHLETFGTTDDLADAKFELVEALGPGGTAILPVDEPRLARPHAGRTVTFGAQASADVWVSDVALDDQGRPRFSLHTPAGEREVGLAMSGRHHALNAAAAAAAALAAGADLDEVVAGLEGAGGSPWRMEIHRGRFTVVNDAYNANPTSVGAALRTVAEMPGRHVAILGEMAELGHVAAAEHRKIGSLAAGLGFAAVIVVGTDHGIAAGAGRVARSVPDAATALDVAAGFVRAGDVVLVKASRAVGLERLAHELVELASAVEEPIP